MTGCTENCAICGSQNECARCETGYVVDELGSCHGKWKCIIATGNVVDGDAFVVNLKHVWTLNMSRLNMFRKVRQTLCSDPEYVEV